MVAVDGAAVAARELRQHPDGRRGAVVAQHPHRARPRRLGPDPGARRPSAASSRRDLEGSGVTDAATLDLALTAANRLTHEILEGLAAADLRAAATNAVIAHPLGILKGVDHLFTGKVERVDAAFLQTLLANGIVPVVPPLGLDGEGHTFRVNSDAVALEAAKALAAVKLVYITTTDGLLVDGAVARQLSVRELADALQRGAGRPRPRLEGAPRGRRVRGGRPARARDQRPRRRRACWPRCSPTRASARSSTPTTTSRSAGRGASDVRAIEQLIKSSIEKDELAPAHARLDREGARRLLDLRGGRQPDRLRGAPPLPGREEGRARLPLRAALAREPGHRPQAGAVRGDEGARGGARRSCSRSRRRPSASSSRRAASPRARPTTCRPRAARATSRAAGARRCW